MAAKRKRRRGRRRGKRRGLIRGLFGRFKRRKGRKGMARKRRRSKGRRRRRKVATVTVAAANPRRRRRRRRSRRRNPKPFAVRRSFGWSNPRRRKRRGRRRKSLRSRSNPRRGRRIGAQMQRFLQMPTVNTVVDAMQGAAGFGGVAGMTKATDTWLAGQTWYPDALRGAQVKPWVTLGLGFVMTNVAAWGAGMLPFKGRSRLSRNVRIGGYIAVGASLLKTLNDLMGNPAANVPVLREALAVNPLLSDYVMDFGNGGVSDYVTAQSRLGDYVEAGQLGMERVPSSGHLAGLGVTSDLGHNQDWSGFAHDYSYGGL